MLPTHANCSKVLVADDTESNRFFVQQLLQRENCDVTLAEDGLQATAFAKVQKFDLILMDLNMPGMSGWEAARLIRTSRGPSQLSPIYALTAQMNLESAEEIKSIGIQGCLLKPLSAKVLRTILIEVTSKRIEFESDASQDIVVLKHAIVDHQVMKEMQELLGQSSFKLKMAMFVSEVNKAIVELRNFEKSDAKMKIANLAHRLAGSEIFAFGKNCALCAPWQELRSYR
jgi:CheY-like chemotaxis protein